MMVRAVGGVGNRNGTGIRSLLVLRLLLLRSKFEIVQGRSGNLEALKVLAFPALVGAYPNLTLELQSHLLLTLAAIHPLGPGVAKVAGDLENGTALARRAGLVALFATKTTRPTALGAADFG